MTESPRRTPAIETRQRLIAAATRLLVDQGRSALTSRTVSAAAGCQPTAIYRLFGNMDELLDRVAAHGFEEYLRSKQALTVTDDPIADLRRAWDLHIEFGLTRPAFYILMFGEARTGTPAAAGAAAVAQLRQIMTRVGAAGRLRRPLDDATRMMHAGGVGVVLTTIALPPDQRDPALADAMRESLLKAIAIEEPDAAGAEAQALALRETLRHRTPQALSPNESNLLLDWLDRLTQPLEGHFSVAVIG
jgi:AcrR family transcriptional regulator